MDIRRLDPHDERQMADWHTTYDAAHRFGLDHATPWALQEARAHFLVERPGQRTLPFTGYVDGQPVVVGLLKLPLMDNLATADLDVATRPDDRRKGHGSAMLEHLVRLARDHGRDVLLCEASWNHDQPPDGTGTPAAEFLTARGFSFALGDVTRALELPVPDELLDRLARQAATAHEGYVLSDFTGPVPDDLVEDFGRLVGSLVTEAPQGDLEMEQEVFDAARIRSDEEVLVAAGRRKYSTVATSPDGELVAFTELAVAEHDPGRAYQWGTLVRPDHRGHRLGLAVKVHNLRLLQSREPGLTTVTTWNAEVNKHMIAVNEELGFRPVGRLGEFQRKLDG